jgi:hypothetical protein
MTHEDEGSDAFPQRHVAMELENKVKQGRISEKPRAKAGG